MGYKLTLFSNSESLKPDVKCTACSRILDSPVCLPCQGRHLVCLSCLRSHGSGSQRLFRCPACQDRVEAGFAADASVNYGVPNWIRVELNSLRLACPKRCGAGRLKIADLACHFATDCGKAEVACGNSGCGATYKREAEAGHEQVCSFKRVQCRACKMSMLNKDLPAHQMKTRCHELEMKLTRKQCMKQCNKDVLDHYKLLRDHSLVSMQEFRRTELSHLERMGVQGFVRRKPLPTLACLPQGGAYKRCGRCSRMFSKETNHDMACRWHGGPTFGGLCLACGKPSHTVGCIISAHQNNPVALSANSAGLRRSSGVHVRS